MTTVDVYADPALEVLARAAESVAYKYDDYVSFETMYQEAWLYRIRHTTLVGSFLNREEGPDMRGLEKVIRSYLETLARQERALVCGFHVDDECYYTPKVLAELLPICLDIEAALLPSAPSDDAPGRGSNPHGQGDFVTSLLDVREAWTTTAFRGDEMGLIKARYVDDMSWEFIAATHGVDVEEVQRRTSIGLRRMSERLGGLPARSCKGDCECKEIP
jgi:hypothetical protein